MVFYRGFPSHSAGKESTCNVGDLGSIPGLGRSPGGGHGNPLKYSCLENPHGQRSLAGCRPWGRRAPDTTERTARTLLKHSRSSHHSPDTSRRPFTCFVTDNICFPISLVTVYFYCFSAFNEDITLGQSP